MAKECGFCGRLLTWPKIFTCHYCQKTFCDEHRLAESHECGKVLAARHIEKNWLRKRGINITTGRYSAVCKHCRYTSEYGDIEEANQMRIDHIKERGCPAYLVQLREHEEDRAADSELAEQAAKQRPRTEWMQECLKSAKTIILVHHNLCTCDREAFFRTTTYDLYVQDDKPNVYAYINVIHGSSHFPIAIHPALSQDTPANRRMLNVVLVHELLHALHQEWEEGKVLHTEKLLAKKGGYFDALQDLVRLGFSGSMHF